MLTALILILGGIAAGIINTLAGNGSVITLSLCTELIGLSPSVANGTNRLGVFTQSISGTWALHAHKKLKLEKTYIPMAVVIAGALVGIWIATAIQEEDFKKLYPWFLLFVLIILLLKPDKWIKPMENPMPILKWYTYPVFFAIGVYGGLIQLGVGVFFLAAMILLSNYPWPQANAAKIVVVAIFTLFAVIIFGASGMLDLQTAVYLALGQSVGAWMAVKYFIGIPSAQKISYYLLITVTSITLLRHFL